MKTRIALAAATLLAAGLWSGTAKASDADAPPSIGALKQLSFEELMNVEVTSVSRRPEKLSETASAIQVVTGEEIHRSGATSLPEALRLAGNLEIQQINTAQWAISARGFDAPLSNKLLVLIDGRTVYTPLFSGVFWDIQDVMLEDLDRIEVISGPGATVWGANAVNGVINVTSKNSKDTTGLLVAAGDGTELHGFGAIRYGAAISPKVHFRVYGKYTGRESTLLATGRNPGNDWGQTQGGFRLDAATSDNDLFTLQGDLYESTIDLAGPKDLVTHGANLLGRWSHVVSSDSDFKLQVYADRVHRDSAASFNDTLTTYDVDFQYRLAVGSRQNVVAGAGYRSVEDNFRSGSIGLRPERTSLETLSAFVQDEIALIPDELHLALGTKLEHNDYTGLEVQPSVRLAWKVQENQTIWAAVSRAVRTPSRVDRDYYIPPISYGSPNLESEELIAYELGYRTQLRDRLTLSVSSYFHDYDRIRSIEPANPGASLPLVFGNGQEGSTYGVEISSEYRVTDAWHLRAAVSELRVRIRPKPGSFDLSAGQSEAADSKHHFLLRSSWDLSKQVQFDATARAVSRVENPSAATPGYGELDLRLAWQASNQLEVAIVGQNLLHDRHPELGVVSARQEIGRSVYGKILWRY